MGPLRESGGEGDGVMAMHFKLAFALFSQISRGLIETKLKVADVSRFDLLIPSILHLI